MITEGLPACRDACKVPAPPWWTWQEQRGRSHWCGASATKKQFARAKAASSARSSAPAPPASLGPAMITSCSQLGSAMTTSCSRAQPPSTTARRSMRRSARSTRSSICRGDASPPAASSIIEPNPIAMGVDPARMKASSSSATGEGKSASTSSEGRQSSLGSQAPVQCTWGGKVTGSPFAPKYLATGMDFPAPSPASELLHPRSGGDSSEPCAA
mmetsp:Transcript_16547/g.44936  ORF Transcript_16547/g.44936 Transcript_16547/m.44936 type:complete len:214 (-) Transcript_16547:825-1466(-)